ncbi:hypothetical protein ECC02_011961 [Trypanosoma cruzi]|uniref:Uncharacterized protein n=1 Tax=Trypanosoma cruzi TaxID=5693 RepID=A0A7J6XLI6_TRYCR|nr:hypothetical protein ECC02_011961 [Trypanosoma cruzi]
MILLLPVCVATPAEGGHKREGCRRCVCRCHATTSQQTCCDSVILTSLRPSRTAEARPTSMRLVDGLRHLSRRCREQDVLTQPQRAWSVTMAQSAVAGGIFTSRRQQRERERELLLLLAFLLPFVASHADCCLSADHGWHASTSDVVCRHFTAPVKHKSRRMLWLWMWCRECSRHYFARLLFTALRQIDASPPEPFTAAPCVVLPAQDSPVVWRLADSPTPLRWDMQGCGLPLTVLGTAVWMRRPHERMYCGTIKCVKYAQSQRLQ